MLEAPTVQVYDSVFKRTSEACQRHIRTAVAIRAFDAVCHNAWVDLHDSHMGLERDPSHTPEATKRRRGLSSLLAKIVRRRLAAPCAASTGAGSSGASRRRLRWELG